MAIALSIAMLAPPLFPGRLAAAAEGAETSAEPSDADRLASAQALFDEGRALLLQGRPREACPKLEQSQRLDPGLGTQFNLAACYEQLGKLASAHALFIEVAEGARTSGQGEREQIARERAAAIEPRLGRLAIVVPAARPAELRVERDGAELGRDEWNVPAAVDPGLHRVRAWGPGVGEWASEVNVAADGTVREVKVPVGEERSFFDPLHRKIGLAAAGLGVAGVLVGSFFGVRAIAKKNEAARAGCDGRECSTVQSGAIRDQARSAGDVATVAMTIGASGLATAAVLLWIVPEPAAEGAGSNGARAARLEVSPQVSSRAGGVWFRGVF
jgi:hypothetical protein